MSKFEKLHKQICYTRTLRGVKRIFAIRFATCSFIVDKNKCMNCKTRENSEKKKEIEKNVKKIKKSG